MAAYSSATAILKEKYEQTVISGSVSGQLAGLVSPLSTLPVAVSFGAEYREEQGASTPDECLKLAPTSCLGGAGGNQLPIRGGFDAHELFGEAIIPLVTDHPLFKTLNVELGYRFSDYNPTGVS